jgi:hypothetical protein
VTDAELRALVRDAVRRHLGDGAPAPSAAPSGLPILTEPHADSPWRHHASHVQYLTLVNVGDACLIEPGVECNHCGYCKSHGH